MAVNVNAKWTEVSETGGSLVITGTTRGVVDWGDGTIDRYDGLNFDTDRDGTNDAIRATHSYAADGLYDVAATDPAGHGNFLQAIIDEAETSDQRPNSFGTSDLVIGGSGSDLIKSGGGDDIVDGRNGDDALFLSTQNDFGFGGNGNDILRGEFGNDVLHGDAGNDRLNGGRDEDVLYGGAGQDNLSGGTENDTLEGGAGTDRLSGGTGADIFLFTAVDANPVDRDFINDFSHAEGDKLDFSALGPLAFRGENGFTGVGHEIRFQDVGPNTVVTVDLDGDRRPDLVVSFAGNHALVVGDFVL